MIGDELRSLTARLGEEEFPAASSFGVDELARRVAAYEAASEHLCRAFALLGYWGSAQLARYCSDLIAIVASARDRGSGVAIWLQLYAYPAQLLFYAFGLGALIGGRYDNVGHLFRGRLQNYRGEWLPAVVELHNQGPLDSDVAKGLPDMDRRRTPSSDWLWQVMHPLLIDLLPSEARLEWEFDRFEVLIGLAFLNLDERRGGRWAPGGRFTWRSAYQNGAASATLDEIDASQKSSALVGSVFASVDDLTAAVDRYRDLFRLPRQVV